MKYLSLLLWLSFVQTSFTGSTFSILKEMYEFNPEEEIQEKRVQALTALSQRLGKTVWYTKEHKETILDYTKRNDSFYQTLVAKLYPYSKGVLLDVDLSRMSEEQKYIPLFERDNVVFIPDIHSEKKGTGIAIIIDEKNPSLIDQLTDDVLQKGFQQNLHPIEVGAFDYFHKDIEGSPS